jgi:hypothetical protein
MYFLSLAVEQDTCRDIATAFMLKRDTRSSCIRHNTSDRVCELEPPRLKAIRGDSDGLHFHQMVPPKHNNVVMSPLPSQHIRRGGDSTSASAFSSLNLVDAVES